MVSAPGWVPDRGELVWLSFTPQAGSEQAGRRPAVVVSPKMYNGKAGLALFCPVTSRVKGYPFEVKLPEQAGVHGVVLADQLRSLDWRARDAERIGRLPRGVIGEVLKKLAVLVG